MSLMFAYLLPSESGIFLNTFTAKQMILATLRIDVSKYKPLIISNLSDDRSTASSKTIPPLNAI
jgi:hypothetical protein